MNIPREKLEALSMEALRALNKAVCEVIDAKLRQATREMRRKLDIGSPVTFFSKQQNRQVDGIVKEIKIKAAVVHEVNREGQGVFKWNVPMAMLSLREDPDKPKSEHNYPTF